MNIAFSKAVEIAGSQTKVAIGISKIVGKTVHQPAIHYWLYKSASGVPADYCPAIEQITNGAVTKSDLRPDLWPPQ